MRTANILMVLLIMNLIPVFGVDTPSGLTLVAPDPSDIDESRDIPRIVSRTSGVAPLSVHFSAGFASSTITERSFHDYDYSWSFGDIYPGGDDEWGTTGKPKNIAKGPVATHIFETPGNYTVSLTIRDSSGIIDTDSFNITVTDPDIVFAGMKTTYVSTGVDFSDAPSGHRYITTNDLSDVTQYAGPGFRLLFKRGDSWIANNLTFPNGDGECIIGAYGSGTGQDELGLYDNAPRFTINSGNFLGLKNKQDWRIMDLHLIDPTRANKAFSGASAFQRILFSGLEIEGFYSAFEITHYNTGDILVNDQLVVNECHIYDIENSAIYIGGERLALLGNKIEDTDHNHVIRVWQAYMSTIQHNIVKGLNNSTTGHTLKLHGPHLIGPLVEGSNTLLHRTEFSIISDNTFGGTGVWSVAIGPQNASYAEETWDMIFERNRLISQFGNFHGDVTIGLIIWGRFISIRNNIFDGTDSSKDYIGISIEQRGIEPAPRGINVFNNSIYRSDNSTEGYYRVATKVGSNVRESKVFNNLVSFPNALASGEISTVKVFTDASPDLSFGNNLLTETPYFDDPDNIDPLSRSFDISALSPAVNNGLALPVYDDFEGNTRSSVNIDIGAFER